MFSVIVVQVDTTNGFLINQMDFQVLSTQKTAQRTCHGDKIPHSSIFRQWIRYKFSNRGLKMSYVNNLWRTDSALLTITDSQAKLSSKSHWDFFSGRSWGIKIGNTCILLSPFWIYYRRMSVFSNQSQHHSRALNWYKKHQKLFLKGNVVSNSAGFTTRK